MLGHLSRHPRIAVTTAVATLALTAAGAYAASASISVSGTDTVVTLTHNTNLSATGMVETPILKLTLPATSKPKHYVIAAQGDFVNYGPSDYTRCIVEVNSTQISAVTATLGDPIQSGNKGPASLAVPFALTGGVTVPTSGATATLECSHDFTNGSQPYVDANTSIWAHQTTSLQTATE